MDMCRGGGAEGAGLIAGTASVWGILVWGRRGGGRGRGKHLLACTDSGFCYQDGRSGWSVRHCRSHLLSSLHPVCESSHLSTATVAGLPEQGHGLPWLCHRPMPEPCCPACGEPWLQCPQSGGRADVCTFSPCCRPWLTYQQPRVGKKN